MHTQDGTLIHEQVLTCGTLYIANSLVGVQVYSDILIALDGFASKVKYDVANQTLGFWLELLCVCS